MVKLLIVLVAAWAQANAAPWSGPLDFGRNTMASMAENIPFLGGPMKIASSAMEQANQFASRLPFVGAFSGFGGFNGASSGAEDKSSSSSFFDLSSMMKPLSSFSDQFQKNVGSQSSLDSLSSLGFSKMTENVESQVKSALSKLTPAEMNAIYEKVSQQFQEQNGKVKSQLDNLKEKAQNGQEQVKEKMEQVKKEVGEQTEKVKTQISESAKAQVEGMKKQIGEATGPMMTETMSKLQKKASEAKSEEEYNSIEQKASEIMANSQALMAKIQESQNPEEIVKYFQTFQALLAQA